MRKIIIILLSLGIILPTYLLVEKEQKKREIKGDLIEISKAKYGIFNVDVWKEKVSQIIANKIDEFQFDPENREELIKKIEEFLYQGVDYLEATIRSQQYSSIRGFFKNAFASGLNVFDDIRDNVPPLARSIVNDLEKPETRTQIKSLIKGKIDRYANETFAEVDYSSLNAVLYKHGFESKKLAKNYLLEQIDQIKEETLLIKLILYTCALSLFLTLLISTQLYSKVELSFVLTASILVLFLGLFLPMIDIDARISEFNFSVLGEQVSFENQVLYFKSKSILEVVGLMFAQGRLDILFVGFLVLLFSVLFPFTKVAATFYVLMKGTGKSSGFLNFFVWKSGKWSMADVLVVAIFMAYIGFSSILSEQLSQIEKISDSLQILTTNMSELNTGFFMFFGFVCLSLAVSVRVRKIEK